MTKQACSYRDQKGDLDAVGAQVIGVSGDNPGTLGLFAMEHNLNFPLLSDGSGSIEKIFGDPVDEGTLIYRDSEVEAANDSNKVLKFLTSLQ